MLRVGKHDDTDADPYEALLDAKKRSRGVTDDTGLDEAALRELVGEYKTLIRERGARVPGRSVGPALGRGGRGVRELGEPARGRLPRSVRLPIELGHGGERAGDGVRQPGRGLRDGWVLFTRNPSTGEPRLFGEFLVNAQGEDVVAGTRTPQPILAADRAKGAPPSLEEAMPESYEELALACDRLEHHFEDMQDIEFTVQQGKLWILQTRSGKRAGHAMLKIAVDLVEERLVSERAALVRLDPEQLEELLHPVFDAGAGRRVIARGLAASPGAAVGRVVFRPGDVVDAAARGEDTILVRDETSPEDIEGMVDARGILTARGGMTSHAAVVARGMGKCCVTGCSAIAIDYAKRAVHREDRGRRDADGTRGRCDLARRQQRRGDARRAATCGRTVPTGVRSNHGVGWMPRDGCACARTPTRPRTPNGRARSGPRASASAGPSTCSSARIGSSR